MGNVVKAVCCSVHLLFKEISKTNCYVNNTGFPPEMLELVVGKGVEEDTVNSLHCLLKKQKTAEGHIRQDGMLGWENTGGNPDLGILLRTK